MPVRVWLCLSSGSAARLVWRCNMCQCGQCYHPYYYWQFYGPPSAYPGTAYYFPYYAEYPRCDGGILASGLYPYAPFWP
ncbi:MAG: hypothetical protein ABSF00_10140 [Candidatus Bathyarchaeia archaeon]